MEPEKSNKQDQIWGRTRVCISCKQLHTFWLEVQSHKTEIKNLQFQEKNAA